MLDPLVNGVLRKALPHVVVDASTFVLGLLPTFEQAYE